MLIAGICGLVAFAVYGQVAQTRHLDAQVSALAAQNTALTQQISDREREIADAQTVAWLEQEARQLGYIFPGEQLYVIVPPGAAHRVDGRRVGANSDLQSTGDTDARPVGDSKAERKPEPQPRPRADSHSDPDADTALMPFAPRRQCHVRYPLRAAWSSGSSSGS